MITPIRRHHHERRLKRLHNLLKAWHNPFDARDEQAFAEFLQRVKDPKMLTNCSCPMCRGEKYREHRDAEKRRWQEEMTC